MSTDSTAENPLREGLRLERTADPCVVVIFGASGDLTKRKLVPALYRLTQERLLPAEFAIIGFARSPMSHDEFRAKMKDAIATYSEAKAVDDAVWQSFAQGLFYIDGDINNPDSYKRMSALLACKAPGEGLDSNHYREAVRARSRQRKGPEPASRRRVR